MTLHALLNVARATMRVKWRFRLRRSFFGLNPDYLKSVYEQFFYMKYYGGWSLFELYSLPIGLRNWYFELLGDHKAKEKEEAEKASKKNNSRGPSRF